MIGLRGYELESKRIQQGGLDSSLGQKRLGQLARTERGSDKTQKSATRKTTKGKAK